MNGQSVFLRMGVGVAGAALAYGTPVVPAQMAGARADRVFIQALPSSCAHVSVAGGVGVVASHGPGLAPAAADAPRVVTGAPYSATGRSETVRTLADGNRIVHSNTIRYFRDSQGRTRTEYRLSALGPIALAPSSSLVVIDDPAASKRIMLHPELKLATEMPSIACRPMAGEGGAVTFTAAVPAPPPGAPSVDVVFAADPTEVAMAVGPAQPNEVTTSTLPERTINGLRALGKRTELSISAGDLGNELPITVSSETWYSPELQVVLSASHRDPLVGDTTYQLVDIVRNEPAASLFTVPRDYTLKMLPEPSKFEKALPEKALPVPSLQGRPEGPAAGKPKRGN